MFSPAYSTVLMLLSVFVVLFPTFLDKGLSSLSLYLILTNLRFSEIFRDRVRSLLLSISLRGCILCAMEIPILPGITLNRSDGATQCPAAH